MKITVFGSGSWGTALANVLCEKGYKIILWGRNEDKVKKILELRENIYYLPGYKLDPLLEITSDIEYATKDVDIAIFSIPIQGLRDFLKTNKEYLDKIKFFVNTGKGIEISTLKRPSEIIKEELNVDFERVATFSGPSFAKEVMEKKPLAIVIASMNLNTSKYLQDILSLSFMRIYRSVDIIGVEIGGALKNVIAIAAGISDGLGFGYNAKASLITRGLVEINRIAILYGAHPFTILGLSGLGDLVLTSTSVLSRNWTIGKLIGEGLSLEAALNRLNGVVAEGVYTAKCTCLLLKRSTKYFTKTSHPRRLFTHYYLKS